MWFFSMSRGRRRVEDEDSPRQDFFDVFFVFKACSGGGSGGHFLLNLRILKQDAQNEKCTTRYTKPQA